MALMAGAALCPGSCQAGAPDKNWSVFICWSTLLGVAVTTGKAALMLGLSSFPFLLELLRVLELLDRDGRGASCLALSAGGARLLLLLLMPRRSAVDDAANGAPSGESTPPPALAAPIVRRCMAATRACSAMTIIARWVASLSPA